MHSLRRIALQGLRSQSVAVSGPTRSSSSFTSRFVKAQDSRQITWVQTRSFSDSADKTNASPAEEEGGQTATREPSAEEQKYIKEDSIATEDVADASSPLTSIRNTASNAAGAVSSRFRDAADSFRSSDRFNRSDRDRSVRDRPDPRIRTQGNSAGGEPSKILYVGNLYFDLTPERMKKEFSQFGNVTNCKIVTDSSGMSKGFGYIEYEDMESAATAIKELHNQNLEGRRMMVQYHLRRVRTPSTDSRNPPSRTLFVGNLSFQMSDKDLHELFRPIKNVVDVRVAIDRRSGQPRGFAHADFVDQESAVEAKKVLETKVVYGRQLRIDFGLPSSLSRPRDQDQ